MHQTGRFLEIPARLALGQYHWQALVELSKEGMFLTCRRLLVVAMCPAQIRSKYIRGTSDLLLCEASFGNLRQLEQYIACDTGMRSAVTVVDDNSLGADLVALLA